MTFDWMQARRRHSKVRNLKRAAMYRRDLQIRAAMFYRLGHSSAHAKARLASNLEWEFATGGRPDNLDAEEVGAIVDSVYDRRPDHGSRV